MALDLPYYDNIQNIRPSNPKQHFLNQKQAQINAMWDVSTQNNEVVLMQKAIGSTEYIEMPISVDTAIDIGTGFKKGDDFKVFSHKDISINHAVGLMYQYADNYWITINNSDLASAISSIEVRRCNNKLKWVDKQNGAINEIPCVIDYELSSPSPQRDKDIIVANGHCVIICQYNELTRQLEKNDRFIFNGQPFKLSAINNLHYDDIDITKNPLMYLDVYLDTIEPTDDLVNNVANKEYNYTITMNPTVHKQTKGFSGQLKASVYLNGTMVDRDIEWYGNDYVEIDNNGYYTVIGDAGHTAIIEARLRGNNRVYTQVQIAIVSDILDTYEFVLTPNVTEIRQKESIDFNVALYKNGVKQNNEVNATLSSVGHYADLTTLGNNNYNIKCNTISKNNINLILSSDTYDDIKIITIKPFF